MCQQPMLTLPQSEALEQGSDAQHPPSLQAGPLSTGAAALALSATHPSCILLIGLGAQLRLLQPPQAESWLAIAA